MSKSVTRNTTYMSLLENSLQELFSPSSKKALLDYKQLELIDVDQLKLIDVDQLKLLDMKELSGLLDFAVLGTFFQYIGAFFLTLSFGFMAAFAAFTAHNVLSTSVFAENITPYSDSYAYVKDAPIDSAHTSEAQLAFAEDDYSQTSKSSFVPYISNQNGVKIEEASVDTSKDTTTTSEAVLGASTLHSQNSCSFRVVEGKKTVRIASGSQYTPSKVFKLCVDSDQGSSLFGWNFGSKASDNTSNCVSSYELSGVQGVSASVLNETGDTVASCDISLVKTTVLVANNQ